MQRLALSARCEVITIIRVVPCSIYQHASPADSYTQERCPMFNQKKNSLTANLHVFPISRFDSFEMHLPRRVHSSCKEPSYCHGGHSASIWDAGLIVCSGAAWIFSDSPSKVACPLSVSTYPFRLHVEVPDVREPMRVHSPPLRGHHL